MDRIPGFFWFTLTATDIDAALDFYTKVVGWSFTDYPGEGGRPRYAVLQAGDRGIGGVTTTSGANPGWRGYIYSHDVDASVQEITAKGGVVHYGPDEIPGVGRFAIVADPQGAMFELLKPGGPDQPPGPPYTPGHVGWNELHTTDSKAALDFYTAQFGWTHARDFEMGEMGAYRIFAVDGMDAGGMMTSPLAPPAFWLPYFNVEDIDAAHERLKAGGGEVMRGPAEVPGGGFIIQGKDPQGVMFALTGPRK